MNNFLFFLIFIVLSINLYGQNNSDDRLKCFKIDTIKAKIRIQNLNDIKSHKDFWKNIEYIDQFYRGSKAVDSIDANNIILVSYYLNKFGYPERSLLGNPSSIISMVWIHSKYSSINKLTFPIILQGYLKKEITEKDLRTYYIRNLYLEKFNDNGFRFKPLKELFQALEVNVEKKINIKKIVEELDYYNNLKKSKIVIGQWKMEYYDVQIFKGSNNQYFFQKLYRDGSYEPKLLKLVDNMTNHFKFANIISSNFFKIAKDNSLYLLDETGKTIAKYISQ